MYSTNTSLGIFNSKLFDEKTFYSAFLKDIKNCEKEIIIESPFITTERMNSFRSVFKKMLKKDVKIVVITRDPIEHTAFMGKQSEEEITGFEMMGVQTFLCSGNHHRKLAIIDRKILWEGSLNILSQNNSREIMRRIEGEAFATELFEFLNLGEYI
jgi:phosphatidylserine/phosphatidylglycerophosphate/cardiolipin synthase-like enzyme